MAGGRGNRLGDLSKNRPKAAFEVGGYPLVCHAVRDLINTDGIETIYVATGYLSHMVRKALDEHHAADMAERRVILIDSPNVEGSLARLAYTIKTVGMQDACLACGIDVRAPRTVLQGLLQKVRSMSDPQVVIPVSPLTEIAPTHPRVQFTVEGVIVQYVKNSPELTSGPGWHSTLGMRYIARDALQELRNYQGKPESFRHFVNLLWDRKIRVTAFPFTENWQHYSKPEDFV